MNEETSATDSRTKIEDTQDALDFLLDEGDGKMGCAPPD
jgi:hypothetical protein